METVEISDKLSDYEVLYHYKMGNEGALTIIVSRYKGLVHSITKSFYLKRYDREDLLQEGMIALIKAANRYCPDEYEGITFYAFAKKIIHLHMIGVLRKHTTYKNQILNLAYSLERNDSDSEDKKLGIIDVYPSDSAKNPIDVIVEKERLEEVNKFIKVNFTSLEAKVLTLYLENYAYSQIADSVGRSTKSVDNTLCRVKKKLRKGFFAVKT